MVKYLRKANLNGGVMDSKIEIENQKLDIFNPSEGKLSFDPVVFFARVIEYNGEIVYPKDRYEDIQSCKNSDLKKEKYSAWKLLEYAVNRHIGVDFNNFYFKKSVDGKWECDAFYFSISHSDGMVSVALSVQPVGVDVQKMKELNEGFADRILTKKESDEYNLLSEKEKSDYLIKSWAKKECIIKTLGEKALLASARETLDKEFCEGVKIYNGQKYYLCAYGRGINTKTPVIEMVL